MFAGDFRGFSQMTHRTYETTNALFDLPVLDLHHFCLITVRVVPHEAQLATRQQFRVVVHLVDCNGDRRSIILRGHCTRWERFPNVIAIWQKYSKFVVFCSDSSHRYARINRQQTEGEGLGFLSAHFLPGANKAILLSLFLGDCTPCRWHNFEASSLRSFGFLLGTWSLVSLL